MTREDKKRLKQLAKEKRKCAKLYPDWEDNEFNLLEKKYIWGSDHGKDSSFLTWDDAYVYYDRRSRQYYLEIDVSMPGHNCPEAARIELGRLYRCKEGFRNFLLENGLEVHSRIYFTDLERGLCAPSLPMLFAQFEVLINAYEKYLEHLCLIEGKNK